MALLLSFSLKILIIFIRFYQVLISSLILAHCRFRPTCSQYGIESLRRFGILKGSWLTVKRILKCHPLHPGGEDRVPRKTLDIDTNT